MLWGFRNTRWVPWRVGRVVENSHQQFLALMRMVADAGVLDPRMTGERWMGIVRGLPAAH